MKKIKTEKVNDKWLENIWKHNRKNSKKDSLEMNDSITSDIASEMSIESPENPWLQFKINQRIREKNTNNEKRAQEFENEPKWNSQKIHEAICKSKEPKKKVGKVEDTWLENIVSCHNTINPVKQKVGREFKKDSQKIDSYVSEEIVHKSLQKNYAKDTRVLLGCYDGHLFEHSIYQEKTIHRYPILNGHIKNISLSPNKKSFFVITDYDYLYQFDLKSRKCIKKVTGVNMMRMVLTNNGKFIITTTVSFDYFQSKYKKIDIWSTRNLKLICTLELKKIVYHMACS